MTGVIGVRPIPQRSADIDIASNGKVKPLD
jgi:hypothetical protein